MNAYIASSPYQVLNSIQLEYSYKKKADIYVLDQFSNNILLVEHLRESYIFNRVIHVKNLTYKNRRRIKEFMDRNFFYSYKAAKYVKKNVYEQVFFAALDSTVYMLIKYMKKNNSNLVIKKMEDGMGDYIYGGFSFFGGIDVLANRVFRKKIFLEEEEVTSIRNNTYVYAPQLVLNKESGEHMKQMVNNFEYVDFKENINEIFRFRKEDIPSAQILIFDAAVTNGSIVKYDKVLKEMICILNNIFERDEIGIKLHPRRKENIYIHNNVWGCRNIPVEVYYANMKNTLSEKIIIGIMSTSSITPKTIFDEEPYIISLHKIIDDMWDDIFIEQQTKVLERLEDLYHEKGKIYVPENIEQLETILMRLKTNV